MEYYTRESWMRFATATQPGELGGELESGVSVHAKCGGIIYEKVIPRRVWDDRGRDAHVPVNDHEIVPVAILFCPHCDVKMVWPAPGDSIYRSQFFSPRSRFLASQLTQPNQ